MTPMEETESLTESRSDHEEAVDGMVFELVGLPNADKFDRNR